MEFVARKELTFAPLISHSNLAGGLDGDEVQFAVT